MKRLIIFLWLVLSVSSWGFAAEEPRETQEGPANFKYRTITTEEGLVFRVPEDMPIEKKNGILAPIPFDEYMYGKFKQIDERLKRIETKLEAISDSLKEKPPRRYRV